MANKDAINRVNCGGHCCSKRVGSIMLEAETNEEAQQIWESISLGKLVLVPLR